MEELLKSLKLFFFLLGKWSYVILVVYSSGILSFLSLSFNWIEIPSWVIYTQFVVAAVLAPFVAFHRFRIEASTLAAVATGDEKAFLTQLAKTRNQERATKRVLTRGIRSGTALLNRISAEAHYVDHIMPDVQKEVGRWASETYFDIRTTHSVLIANRFGDASTVPIESIGLTPRYKIENFLRDRIQTLQEMKADI